MLTIPKSVRAYLNEANCLEIAKSITEFERQCNAEFIPAIATHSSPVDRQPTLIFMVLSLIYLSCEVTLHFVHDSVLIHSVAAVVILLLTYLLSRAPWAQRLLLSKADMRWSVSTAAAACFLSQNLERARGDNGVLLYISVLERKAVILISDNMKKVISQEELQNYITPLLESLKSGKWQTGIQELIQKLALKLSVDFPPEVTQKQSQLTDRIVFID